MVILSQKDFKNVPAYLRPKDFKHIPAYLRPKRAFKADRDFAKKVHHVKKYGVRSDDDEVADVVTILNNMRAITPRIFKKKGKRQTRKNRH
jgi:hypothetical protein